MIRKTFAQALLVGLLLAPGVLLWGCMEWSEEDKAVHDQAVAESKELLDLVDVLRLAAVDLAKRADAVRRDMKDGKIPLAEGARRLVAIAKEAAGNEEQLKATTKKAISLDKLAGELRQRNKLAWGSLLLNAVLLGLGKFLHSRGGKYKAAAELAEGAAGVLSRAGDRAGNFGPHVEAELDDSPLTTNDMRELHGKAKAKRI